MQDADQIFSTPIGAPLPPTFPFTFRNAEILTVSYRTRPEAVLEFLPAPLRPASDWVLVHFYNMKDVEWLGSYHECNVMVHAALAGKGEGGYSPFLFLDSDGGLAQGREVHGQPKKWGNPRLEARGDLIVGVMERNGIDVITGTTVYKQQRGDIAELKRATFDFALNLNFKVLNHIDGRAAVRQITARRLEDVKIHECWRGPGSVELRPNVQAPVHRLPVVETGEAYYWRADFTLVQGTVLHDYLAGTKETNP